METIFNPSQAASGLFSGVASIISGRKNRAWSAEQAYLNREFQKSEREASQKWQDEQTQRNLRYQVEKEAYDYTKYLSPTARMEAYRRAGLNPDLIYSQGNINPISGSSVSSPVAPVAAHGSQADGSAAISQESSGFQQVGDSFVKAAQIRDLNASADEKQSRSKVNDSIVLKNGSEVVLNDALTSESKQRVQHLKSQISNLDAQTYLFEESWNGLVLDNRMKSLNLQEKQQQVTEFLQTINSRMAAYYAQNEQVITEAKISEKMLQNYDRYTDALISKLLSEVSLNNANASLSTLSAQLQQFTVDWMSSEHLDFDSPYFGKKKFEVLQELTLASLTGNTMTIQEQLDLLKRYGDAHAIVGIVGEFVGSVASMLGGVGLFKTGKAALSRLSPPATPPIKGFSNR